MPAAIDTQVKKQVVDQWLSGDSRDRIAADNGIGAGTVSNIINEWKKGVKDLEYESVRELTVSIKKQGIGLSDLVCFVRLNNYIQKLGANQDQIESFIANLANSPEPERLIEVANQVARLSISESIPLEDLENHLKQKEEEKQRLEEEIQQRRAILDSTNVDVQTISEYTHLKEELCQYRLSTEDPTRLLSILQTIKQIGYEPQKIIATFASMKSLRQKEKLLKNNCKMLEKKLSRYRQVLPLLQDIQSMGISTDKLLVFSVAVNEKAQTHNLPISAAAYRVIEDIEDYNRIGGLKKEISRLATEIYAFNEICAPRNKAITALLKLQALGITDDEIVSVYEFLNRARFESAATIRS
jgi:5'-3' exonuclease